jgi:hypothetical protein
MQVGEGLNNVFRFKPAEAHFNETGERRLDRALLSGKLLRPLSLRLTGKEHIDLKEVEGGRETDWPAYCHASDHWGVSITVKLLHYTCHGDGAS